MADSIRAYAAAAPKSELKPFDYKPGPLGDEDVEIAVSHCGICHSDLSMLDNDWGNTQYPLVAGHEAIGTVSALGAHAKGLSIGQRVGLGWMAGSCMHCLQCMSGHHNMCVSGEQTIVGIGGLGHLALKFLRAWGCEVTAFTSSASKGDEARGFGAHNVVASNDSKALKKIARSLDFILVTVNVPLDWNAMLAALAPRGRLHFVGAVLEPIPVPAFALIGGRKSVSGSPLGSPAMAAAMLEFCARHKISPQVEMFPMSRINDALEHLRAGKARYRVVVENDFR
jgi:alcohol/geraniol dehydrogenase (NADP+)